jgi:hypothetical protein
MPRKSGPRVKDIQDKIATAEKAVKTMTDDALKPIAFQTILQELLASDPAAITEREGKGSASPPKPQRKPESKPPKGTQGRIAQLIEDGFFDQKRTINEIQQELSARTWHYPLYQLNPPLIRLVNKKELRRIKEPQGKGGKLVWRYSKW